MTTDLETMLDQLRHTIAEREQAASAADRARGDMEHFMADASHELRTPLTALRGYSDLYRAGMLDDEELDRAMSRIGAETERLSRPVSDLPQLVRPAESARDETVDMAAIVPAVVDDLRAAHPTREIERDLGDQPGYSVQGDAARLHQAVLNLGANACQHTPADSPIGLRVGPSGDRVCVDVIDSGPGVDVAEADDLFQPFSRGDGSRSRRDHDGADLGLALVRRIARQHGGSFAVSETPGGGATFSITLPFSDPPGGGAR